MSVFKVYGTEMTVSSIGPVVQCVQDLLDSLKLTVTYQQIPPCYVLLNGKIVQESCLLEPDSTYHIIPRLVGGKGGFGSMLRAIGAQIEKTTSREACRDLSGRRMRDINNEKKLKEWLSKEADREKEREDKRQERLAKRLAGNQHKFDDPTYHEQREKVQEGLEDALKTGLKRAHGKSQQPNSASGPSKKPRKDTDRSRKEWLGMDLDSDDLDSESDSEANPGPPSPDTEATDDSSSPSPSSQTKDCSQHSKSAKADSTDDSNRVKEEARTAGIEKRTLASVKKIPGSCTDDIGDPDSKAEFKPSLLSLLPPPSNDDVCSSTTIKQEPQDPNLPIDLDEYSSSSELQACGFERLKNALMRQGLKCGGTLEERAERLFMVKGLSPDQIDPSLFAKSKGKGKKTKQNV